MAKSAAKSKVINNVVNAESSEPSGISWIPAGPASTVTKKSNDSISLVLDIKYISTKVDKFGRCVKYFACKNPDALGILKEHIDKQGLSMDSLSLPFWQGDDTVMIRVGLQNCALSDQQLEESSLTGLKVPVEFKFYSSAKGRSGYPVHL